MNARLPICLLASSACAPIVSPPAHVKLGYAYSSERTPLSRGRTSHKSGLVSVALDTANIVEYPVNAAFGIQAASGNSGLYLASGWVRRLSTHARVVIDGAGDRWWARGGGYGVHTTITLEYTTTNNTSATSEYDPGNDGTHDQTTTYLARAGSFAIGGYVDVGHRWLESEPNDTYISLGLSFRLAAAAGVVDLTGVH